jgi:hypothetical protein
VRRYGVSGRLSSDREPEPGIELEAGDVRVHGLESATGFGIGTLSLPARVRPAQRRRVAIDCDDVMAGQGKWQGEPARSGHQLEDRPVARGREREIHLDVRLIVVKIEVVVARKRLRRA